MKGFLYRELDFYIKSEIIHLDDLDTTNEQRVETYLAKVKAIKRVGHIIIDFLAQIEDFQKKLWLKKKFVVETNWCMTLDNIDESFWSEIIANSAQIQEWIEMYAIDEVEGDLTTVGWTNPPTMEFLHQNQNLVVDTKHFSTDFKDRLVASIENLDEQTGGLMINGDNFHALLLLRNRYESSINCIYIDPPYNTDASKILYKNNYEHSSWLALMYDRVVLGKSLLKKDGVQATAIDEYELQGLYGIEQDIFGRELNAGIIAIRINPSGRPREGGLALSHEYTLVFKNSWDSQIMKISRSDEQLKRYDKRDEYGVYEQRNFRREGSNSDRADGIRQWYPIYVNVDNMSIRIPQLEWNEDKLDYNILEKPCSNEEVVWPITDDGQEKNWRWAYYNVQKDYSQFYAIRQKSGIQVYYKFRPNQEGISPVTFWDDKKYSATENGTKILKEILPGNAFSYPKSIYACEDILQIIGMKKGMGIALDYFAGSATTGHAILNLNRLTGGYRKYILIEMGEYFNTVSLPRMKKCIYSTEPKSWKNGKPTSRNTGVSHIMKYFSLESYEDALSNVRLFEENKPLYSLFGEDYLIHYMLDVESRGSLLDLEQFKSPFSYQMKITERNETKKRPVDLVETFNYLIGLSVVRQSAVSYFRALPDSAEGYEGAVRLMKDDGGEFGFKQVEGTLPDGRRALVIWRTVTDDLLASNAALDAYFTKHRINPHDREFDVIYVNGDNNLENLRTGEESWKVQMTEIEFKNRMFEEV